MIRPLPSHPAALNTYRTNADAVYDRPFGRPAIAAPNLAGRYGGIGRSKGRESAHGFPVGPWRFLGRSAPI